MREWNYYYEWDGEKAVPVRRPPPIDDPEYFEKHNRVGHDEFKTPFGDVRVSTVFLVIDHSFGEGPPVLWETMVFGGLWDEYQWRYTSRQAAEEGHSRIVATLKAGGDLSAPESCSDTSTAEDT